MKSVLITGASGGMGRATAELFASTGYRVFALDRRECLPSENIIPIACDVTDEESLLAARDSIGKYTSELFAIIHFAGVYMLDSLIEMSEKDFERIFKINLFAAFKTGRQNNYGYK